MNRTFTVREYDVLTRDAPTGSERFRRLPAESFDALERLLLSGRQNGADAADFFSLSGRRSVGKVIGVKNYVGVVALGDGTAIEILPKVFSGDAQASEAQARAVFLEMLQTLREIPRRSFQSSGLRTARVNLFELFLRMFLDEALRLVREGLCASYAVQSRNECFCRGKLSVPLQIQYNLVHEERFFVERDELGVDRPENRLVLSTLLLLAPYAADAGSRRDLHALRYAFRGVSPSQDPAADFARVSPDRAIQSYGRILPWCRLFLSGSCFTAFSGANLAYCLLFPMERLFERFVTEKLGRMLSSARLHTSAQDRTYSLFDDPRRFSLRPDLVVTGPGGVAVLDAKWKLLCPGQRNFGISQADMYQMYAYAKKYGAREVLLLYPRSHGPDCSAPPVYRSGDGAAVSVHPVDLLHAAASLSGVAARIESVIV
ncbi:MAG TPA: McrC family protein [Oscillospiraceae bacterium]|nr:McrC family protein [Oscillospiraceae bacterium]